MRTTDKVALGMGLSPRMPVFVCQEVSDFPEFVGLPGHISSIYLADACLETFFIDR